MITKKTYSEKLKDPRWQKKRLEIMERDKWHCRQCLDNESTLHVHHRRYFKGKEPWDIDNKYLVTLCESCHEAEGDSMNEVAYDIMEILKETFFADEIKNIATGFLDLKIQIAPEVTSSILRWGLSDPQVMEYMADKYFEYAEKVYKEKHHTL